MPLPIQPRYRAAWLVAALLVAPAPARAVDVPWPFVVEDVVPDTAFTLPVSFAFTGDGRILVAEKGGVLRVVRDGVVQPDTMWDGRTEVLDQGDRGFLAVTVDPDFASNRFVYLLYSVDPDSDGVDTNDDAFGRLTRYATRDSNPDVLDPDTRTVLVGASWASGMPSGSTTHGVGGLRWGVDGSLLVSAGEGAHYVDLDVGGRDPDMFAPGAADSAEDIGAFRAQMLGSLAGKILRINPHTGSGYASNPFADSDLYSKRSRVWAYGLRNPYRFCVRPGTGSPDTASGNPGMLSIGDVGWETWEELETATLPGHNFGWPCLEGLVPDTNYAAATPPACGCETIGSPQNPSYPVAPTIVWNHWDPALSTPTGIRGSCVIGGVFYDGAGYPSLYRGRLFFGDFGEQSIMTAEIDPDGQVVNVAEFTGDAEGPVDFGVDPETGDVMFLALYTARLYRIRYTGVLAAQDVTPRASVTLAGPNPSTGTVSLALSLDRQERVGLEVLDLSGRRLRADTSHDFGPGRWTVRWDGRDGAGVRVPPGVYWIRLSAGTRAFSRRVVIVR